MGRECQQDLMNWGWVQYRKMDVNRFLSPGQSIARVTAVFRDHCLLFLSDGERMGQVTGRFRHLVQDSALFPAVGDWVVVECPDEGLALIHEVLPRRSVLSRAQAGRATEEQVLAANVDVMFVMTAFDEDFNVRRIERYAVMARQAGMDPVVVLNKSDLACEADVRVNEARAVSPGGAVHCVSAKTGEGIDAVKFYLQEGKTGVFLGSSGVGKSTLLNALLGSDVQETNPIRVSDGKGRHTTTTRQMFLLPEGGLVIDTPGLREIQLWADETILSEVFSEIDVLARSCRYKDCQHKAEPGCAVKGALDSGVLPMDRYNGYLKLQKELAYLKRKQDPTQRSNTKRRWKKIHNSMRDYVQGKRKI